MGVSKYVTMATYGQRAKNCAAPIRLPDDVLTSSVGVSPGNLNIHAQCNQ